MNPAHTFLILFCCHLSTSCASWKLGKDKEPANAPSEQTSQKPKLLGKVASIPADRKFVLIQSFGKWTVETGSIITTRGEDARTANLVATGEQLGEFAAADIQSGLVEVGDGVYSKPSPTPSQPSSSPESLPPPENSTTENVQKNN